MSLSQDLLLGKLTPVAGHQLRRGHLDHFVLHGLHRADPEVLLLEGDLTRHVPDEIIRNVKFLRDVFGGVDPPGDGELDEAEDVGGAVAGVAADLASRLRVRGRGGGGGGGLY